VAFNGGSNWAANAQSLNLAINGSPDESGGLTFAQDVATRKALSLTGTTDIADDSTTTTSSGSAQPAPAPNAGATYTIQKGDNLSKMAVNQLPGVSNATGIGLLMMANPGLGSTFDKYGNPLIYAGNSVNIVDPTQLTAETLANAERLGNAVLSRNSQLTQYQQQLQAQSVATSDVFISGQAQLVAVGAPAPVSVLSGTVTVESYDAMGNYYGTTSQQDSPPSGSLHIPTTQEWNAVGQFAIGSVMGALQSIPVAISSTISALSQVVLINGSLEAGVPYKDAVNQARIDTSALPNGRFYEYSNTDQAIGGQLTEIATPVLVSLGLEALAAGRASGQCGK
jgi:LysM repeat protein